MHCYPALTAAHVPPMFFSPTFGVRYGVDVVAPLSVTQGRRIFGATVRNIPAVDEFVFISLAAVWTIYINHLNSLLSIAITGAFKNQTTVRETIQAVSIDHRVWAIVCDQVRMHHCRQWCGLKAAGSRNIDIKASDRRF